jgi:D-aminopeptidase
VRIPHQPTGPLLHREELDNDAVSPLFLAAIEATEEAIVNSLFMARTTKGRRETVEALPMEKVIAILKKYNRLQ